MERSQDQRVHRDEFKTGGLCGISCCVIQGSRLHITTLFISCVARTRSATARYRYINHPCGREYPNILHNIYLCRFDKERLRGVDAYLYMHSM